MSEKTLIQYFEWYLPCDGKHWNRAAEDAPHLAWLGITDVWLPPAYKCQDGMTDVGYGVYDLYDLGEFYQKGTIPTKYGTREEYLNAVRSIRDHGLGVIADVVLNHRMGADYKEDTIGTKVESSHRLTPVVHNKKLTVWTGFNFPGRNGKYSNFYWNRDHFSGVDWNEKTHFRAIFKLKGHQWSPNVSSENDNYDYLMGANVDFSVPEVAEELKNWGRWYVETTKVNGVRLDAVKHIDSKYYPGWLREIRAHALEKNEDEEFFAVGEYWEKNIWLLMQYLEDCEHSMTVFDVPLQEKFRNASEQGAAFDLTKIFDGTLVKMEPEYAVTIVDNHDTQPGQALYNWVGEWFKPLAYALILLREAGTPCVFYGDLYGIPHDGIPPVPGLEEMLLVRRRYAHGAQVDYFDFPNVIGWTREGGLAVVMSNGGDGWKDMKLGYPGQKFVDALNNRGEEVTIDENGYGRFNVNGGSVSVWIPKQEK